MKGVGRRLQNGREAVKEGDDVREQCAAAVSWLHELRIAALLRVGGHSPSLLSPIKLYSFPENYCNIVDMVCHISLFYDIQ